MPDFCSNFALPWYKKTLYNSKKIWIIMKRIEFIAPVSAMRGNLSGAQDLKYPTQDNKAYEGPLGYTNYARNYTPRFIGAKVAQTGHKYFTTRTKSANHLTNASKHAMALMGGVGAMVATLYRDKTATIYQNLYAQWVALQERGDIRTFRKYLSDGIREMLANKKSYQAFPGPAGAFTVQNPWVSDVTPNVVVSNAVLVKFWDELATNPIYFFVESQKAVARTNMAFGQGGLVSKPINILGLEVDSDGYITMPVGSSDYYLKDPDNDYVSQGDVIVANGIYRLTATAPE